MPQSLLLIDDDPRVLAAVGAYFRRAGWTVRAAPDGRTGVELYLRERADLVVTDLEMPGMDGHQVIDVLRAHDPDTMVLVLTAHDDVRVAVQAMQAGAESFLTKPLDYPHLDLAVARAMEKVELRRHARRATHAPLTTRDLAAGFDDSPAMRQVGDLVAAYATASVPVLVTGETGTGKEWVARRLHAASPRATEPFVSVGCAGLVPSRLGMELFGVERDALADGRGADRSAARGLLDAAHGGTLFLDDVGALPLSLQPLLLRVLESGCFRRVGGAREIAVDVRVIAATQRDLRASVRAGTFRQDLYYRLAALTLDVPPLRARGAAAVAEIAQQTADAARHRVGQRPVPLSDAALHALACHDWPGNVRELRNAIEHAALLARTAGAIDVAHLPAELREPAPPTLTRNDLSLRAAERAHVLRVLALCDGNKARAARALGITRATLYTRLGEYAA